MSAALRVGHESKIKLTGIFLKNQKIYRKTGNFDRVELLLWNYTHNCSFESRSQILNPTYQSFLKIPVKYGKSNIILEILKIPKKVIEWLSKIQARRSFVDLIKNLGNFHLAEDDLAEMISAIGLFLWDWKSIKFLTFLVN